MKVENIANADLKCKVFKESHMDTHKEIVQALHMTSLVLKAV